MAVAGGRRRPQQGPLRGEFVGPNPTDRAKPGTKRGLLTDGDGGPLSLVIAPANAHDSTLLAGLVEAVVVDRPAVPERLYLDKGFDTPAARDAAVGAGYEPVYERVGVGGKRIDPATGRRPRRWVVERTIGWLNKCRALLVRYDKKAGNYLGLTELACCLLWWRRLGRLHGEPVSG